MKSLKIIISFLSLALANPILADNIGQRNPDDVITLNESETLEIQYYWIGMAAAFSNAGLLDSPEKLNYSKEDIQNFISHCRIYLVLFRNSGIIPTAYFNGMLNGYLIVLGRYT